MSEDDALGAVRARYVQAMTRRMEGAPPAVRRVLEARLRQRAAAPVSSPGATAPPSGRPRSEAAGPSPLAGLYQSLGEAAGAPGELRSAQAFREVWSRVSAEDEVTQALDRAPENAGPLNSHMLVLRTLDAMRALSPDYLRRFVSQMESWLWLEQAAGALRPPAGKAKGRAARQKK